MLIKKWFLKKKYYIDISKYDVIKGWRADDSYYSYAKSFIFGSLYRETLDKALCEGDLGTQYCIKTKKAFDALTFITRHSASEYDAKNFLDNDRQARSNFTKLCESQEEGHVVYSYL